MQLQASWTGSAAVAFQTVVDQWRVTQRQVEDSLAGINAALAAAGRQYADAEHGDDEPVPLDAAKRQNSPSRRRGRSVRLSNDFSGSEVHATRRVAGRSGDLLGLVGDDGLGGEEQRGDRRGVLQRRARDLRRVDDALREQVAVLAGRGVEAVTDGQSSATLLATTPGSRPAFSAICLSGASIATRTMFAPVASSPTRLVMASVSNATLPAWMSATPPPGTMPSSTAAFALRTASSMRCLRSFSSTSVAAPALMTATPPASLARRSWSFSRS